MYGILENLSLKWLQKDDEERCILARLTFPRREVGWVGVYCRTLGPSASLWHFMRKRGLPQYSSPRRLPTAMSVADFRKFKNTKQHHSILTSGLECMVSHTVLFAMWNSTRGWFWHHASINFLVQPVADRVAQNLEMISIYMDLNYIDPQAKVLDYCFT